MLGVGEPVHQGLECPLARTGPRSEPDPLQHRGVRYQHGPDPQVGQHGLHDWLAAVGGPSGIGTDPQAGAPVAQPEAAQAQDRLQLGGVLAAGLVAPRIVGERRGRCAELFRHEGQQRRGRLLTRTMTLAGMPQEAELYSEA
jgi:hypothetical protein